MYLGNKSGILAIGCNNNPALSSLQSWLTAASITEPVTYITTAAQIAAVNFTQFKLVYLPRCVGHRSLRRCPSE